MSANAELLDRAISHEVDVRRYSESVMRRMIAILNRSDARISAKLAEALMRIEPSEFTVERLETLLASVRRTNREAYAAVFEALRPEMEGLADIEALAQRQQMAAAVPVPVQARFPIAGVAWEQVYAAALSRPFQGRLLRDWAANVEASRMTLIRNAIRQGFVEGLTTADIIRAIKGTKANNYADGILNRARRELAAVVQTALGHTAQTARQAFTDANADLIKAVKWVSTLDNKTSPMCRIRDGLLYEPGTHKPVGHKIPWGDGPGRLHFNCRSVSVNVTKSWRELGLDIDDLPPATRASMDGQVPADTTFGQWLLKQPAARQDEILGPIRGRLLRADKLKLPDFYDGKGNLLSLDELRAKLG